MKRLFIIIGTLIVSGAAIAVAMDQVTEDAKTYSWRYKMTVEVETPEGVRTGSAVREVTVTFTPRYEPDPRDPQYDIHKSMKGEAVVVDLGERGMVFAVQRFDDYALPFSVFEGPPGLTIEGAEFYSKINNAKALLETKHIPRMVTFADMAAPLSVQLVYGKKATQEKGGDPYIFQDNFEKLFGEGVRLKGVTIEMTEEPVVYSIKELLPWLDKYHNELLDGRRIHTIDAENRLANSLGAGSFTTMESKKQ